MRARVFACRTKTVEEIQAELHQEEAENLEDIFLTTALWIEKGEGSVNKGQVMPVGGNMKAKDRDLAVTAGRELVEETHLRGSRFREIGRMQYSIHHPKSRKDIAIEAAFFITDVAPHDRAYPLHPEEDKIGGFHRLDLKGLSNLWIRARKEGELEKIKAEGYPGKTLQDSLQLDPVLFSEDEARERGQASLTKVNADQAIEVMSALTTEMQFKEIIKKIQVMRRVINMCGMQRKDRKEWERRIQEAAEAGTEGESGEGERAANLLYDIQIIWRELIAHLRKIGQDPEDLISRALDLCNFREEIEEEHAGLSRIESVLHFVYALLETRYFDRKYLEIARVNPSLKGVVEKLEKFLGRATKGQGPDPIDRVRALALLISSPEGKEKATKKFEAVFNISKEQYQRRLESVNRFFKYIVSKTLIPRVGKDYREQLDPLNEIKIAKLGDLIRYAFPDHSSLERDEKEKAEVTGWKTRSLVGGEKTKASTEENRRMVFEARRHLALMIFLAEAEEYYDKKIEIGNYHIEKLFQDIISLPVVEKEEGGKYRMLAYQGREYHVKMFPDIKEKESFFRKVLEKGYDQPQRRSRTDYGLENIQDVHRRTIVIDNAPTTKRSIAEWIESGEPGIVFPDPPVKYYANEFVSVLDVMSSIIAGARAKGFGVELEFYKPTNDATEGVSSNSPGGGGGNFRYAKFYLHLRDPKTHTVETEEVQIFVNTEDGKSGSYWKEKKEQDDERYFF